MSVLRVRDILRLKNLKGSTELKVESLPVWDYKVLNNKLKLIWEPILGPKNTVTVDWQEILEYLHEEFDSSEKGFESLEIAPETGGDSFKSVEENDTFINFRLK